MKKNKDWLKLKKYIHISKPFKNKDRFWIKQYVADSDKVKKHKFFPFIHYTIVENKFRRGFQTKGNNLIKEEHRTLKSKKREIYYADHLDSCVFSYYSHILNKELESVYQANLTLNDSVIAYRPIPANKTRNKCNIDFAKEVFDDIKTKLRTNDEIISLCFDIEGFFDNLNHHILKKAWYNLLERKCLPDDHYSVFKAVSQYSYIEVTDLIKEFSELKIKKFSYIKNKDITSFCKSKSEFKNRVVNKGLIRTRKDNMGRKPQIGIAQGTPISATLSNIYMLEFDKKMVELANTYQALYRRYSDDILFVCYKKDALVIEKFLTDEITNLKLNIQPKKTQKVIFKKKDIKQIDVKCYENNKLIKKNFLSYLGFDFDGKTTRIRQKSISKYYRSVKRIIRRKAVYADYNKKKNARIGWKKYDFNIYKNKIFKTKSHLGAKRKKIDNKVYWGNYISYAKSASNIMNEPGIKKQLRNHWRIIDREIQKYENEYDLEKK